MIWKYWNLAIHLAWIVWSYDYYYSMLFDTLQMTEIDCHPLFIDINPIFILIYIIRGQSGMELIKYIYVLHSPSLIIDYYYYYDFIILVCTTSTNKLRTHFHLISQAVWNWSEGMKAPYNDNRTKEKWRERKIIWTLRILWRRIQRQMLFWGQWMVGWMPAMK